MIKRACFLLSGVCLAFFTMADPAENVLALKQIENAKNTLCGPYKNISDEHYEMCVDGINIIIFQSYGQGLSMGLCEGKYKDNELLRKGMCDNEKEIKEYVDNLQKTIRKYGK
ncbi:hypothetical protein [Morganella psychrotolerans]|uniref:hypothetical protein n=1 Tax=Morganella psychrotolerans TaxID=368603 RepID=UPI0039B04E75